DEHGSTSEVAALKAGVPVQQLVSQMHDKQAKTLARYGIDLDVYAGTARPDTYPTHAAFCQEQLKKLHANGMLDKRTSKQWYDVEAKRFLPDRLVTGTCPRCGAAGAYSDECDTCFSQYTPSELVDPKSAVSGSVPEMRDTTHWFLDMAKVQDPLLAFIKSKEKKWRPPVYRAVLELVSPALRFDKASEPAYLEVKAALPKHKQLTAPGKKVMLRFESRADLDKARAQLSFTTELADEWAHRSITRDIAWGIPVPDVDPDLSGKTLYVWPDSLWAPISFSKVARADGEDFWRDPNARVVQFLGQDNVFFYVIMQGALWLGAQTDPQQLPHAGDLQMTDVVGAFHLLVNGEKMSKTKGNFYTGDQLLEERGYDADQIRYYLALLDLSEKGSDFDFKKLDERNRFLAGPLNASLERPISAAHSKFDGKVPDGKLLPEVEKATVRVVERYVKAMERADFSNLLSEHIENYARTINSLFTQHKPHDDRAPLEMRINALYSGFYVLKTLMIMLYPFAPATMNRVRESLRLPASVFALSELGTPIPAGHQLGDKQQYFPATPDAPASAPVDG
ncbi:MAG TPA: class I tRNA ligase family protein, partial [Myxococcota bacterium]